MTATDDLLSNLDRAGFPRSARDDPHWVIENQMGPNALWLAESLSEVLPLQPGMRVLDLGCGRSLTSIFLAKEFGVRVVAADLWVTASENWSRIVQAGVADMVLPLNVEAHDLPFADGYFDAIVSYDAYHYFGTAELYLPSLLRFLRPGGLLGIVVPGVVDELDGRPPEHLRSYWEWEYATFHSPRWWSRLWGMTGLVDVEHADLIPDGWRLWQAWTEVVAELGDPSRRQSTLREAEMVAADAGRTLGLARMVARQR